MDSIIPALQSLKMIEKNSSKEVQKCRCLINITCLVYLNGGGGSSVQHLASASSVPHRLAAKGPPSGPHVHYGLVPYDEAYDEAYGQELWQVSRPIVQGLVPPKLDGPMLN